MDVKLLAYTNNPLGTIYMAIRICHSASADDVLQESQVVFTEKKESLIKKIIKLGHESVIEHVSFSFLISGISRSCSHQLVRHRLASYSQQSQRYVEYADETDGFVIPDTIKNNENGFKLYIDTMDYLHTVYKKLLELNVPKEDARFILPNAGKTNIVVTMNCRELRHFFKLRLGEGVQWEIRRLAKKMLDICYNVLPCVFEDLEETTDDKTYLPNN